MQLDEVEVGRLPALGEVPKRMIAAVIRRERYGPPIDAFQAEEVDVPPIGPYQALVMVMAAGVNYNNVWAALGKPLDVIADRNKRGEPETFHIGGSDGAGVVWAVGDRVRRVKVGDHVVLSGCQWDQRAEDILLGADPITSTSQRSWGYEINYGSFAQFTLVEEYQCLPKPSRLSWEEAGCYLVAGATAYRQLCQWSPNTVHPGDPVLIWGAAGGLGSMAIQIVRRRGGVPIAVVSSQTRAEHCLRLGAKGVLNRQDFDHWGPPPNPADSVAFEAWAEGLRAFSDAFRQVLGKSRKPKIVLEHPGRQTFPTSVYLCDNAGMIVTCGGTTGYDAGIDLRYLWMRQKRIQGSHYANIAQCRAITQLVDAGEIDPCLSKTFAYDEIGEAHQLMYENRHPPGKMAVLINAPCPGLTDLP